MVEPTNLNKARKARDKARAKAEAAVSRASHGRMKHEKAVEALKAEAAARLLDGARRERPEASDDDGEDV
jgi:hypothetical protein